MIGIVPRLPRHMRTAWCGDPLERAVRLREREQQRHAGQRQKELAREPAHDRVDRHPADVDADNPGERNSQHADVEPADAADQHGERERTDRDERHSSPEFT